MQITITHLVAVDGQSGGLIQAHIVVGVEVGEEIGSDALYGPILKRINSKRCT